MEYKTVISGLIKRRSELAGDRIHLETRVMELNADIAHIDGALRAFGHVEGGGDIKPRQSPTIGVFRTKEFPRLLITVLRGADKPMTSFDIAKVICRDKGWDQTNEVFLDSLASKNRRALSKLRNQGRVKSEKINRISYWELV